MTSLANLPSAKHLAENLDLAFIGTQKGRPFDISESLATKMLSDTGNPNSRPNSDVIKPWTNGMDITSQNRHMWVIDFGSYMSLEDAAKYVMPFEYVKENVYPVRKDLRRENHKKYWWIHAESRPGMRKAMKDLKRYICTPRVSKHRVFIWLNTNVLPDSATAAIALDDDYSFGILHSKIHEIWALKQGTSLEDRPRYTPTTTFETFPFPWAPGQNR